MTRAITRLRGAYRAALSRGAGYEVQTLGRHADKGGYFVDLSAKTTSCATPISGRGITLGGTPVQIAQRALGWWERYLDGDPRAADTFLGLASDLKSAAVLGDRGELLWPYRIDFPKYGLRAPWLSAMAQAQAASVFVRTATLAALTEYKDAAARAILPLTRPRLRERLVVELEEGPVLEEYPSSPHSHVLNGWIYALWGVYDVAMALNDARAGELFERSSAAFAARIHRYDLGWWSLYSLYGKRRLDLAKPFYHRLHVTQLEALASIVGEPSLLDRSKRWNEYDTAPRRMLAILAKAREVMAP